MTNRLRIALEGNWDTLHQRLLQPFVRIFWRTAGLIKR